MLVIVEDRHAERELRRALDSLRARGAAATVLTGDALLAMRLRREQIDARLTIDGVSRDVLVERDRLALDGCARAFGLYAEVLGIDFGPYLQYTLIPAFIRSVRNITAVDHQLVTESDATVSTIVLVGSGPLVDAARLVAGRRELKVETVGDGGQRLLQRLARLRAGRTTRWVNTDFRALVLEPGFLALLFAKGFWRRLTAGAAPAPGSRALIVVGDRFTADVVEQLRSESRPIVLAGATQPGRALFDGVPGLIPLEAFTEFADGFRSLVWGIDKIGRAITLWNDQRHARAFVVAGVPYWPLVRGVVCLHIMSWLSKLRHLQNLAARAANACTGGMLLTSVDVTAYTRVLIDTVRRFGMPSVSIQHGIPGEPNGHAVAHADHMAAWGEATEEWYRALGPQKAQFIVTGNPRFDGLARRSQSPIPNPQALFTVAVCTGFVTDFSVGATEYENLLMIDSVLAWAKAQTNVRVIHKMHPGEEPSYYADAGRALGWDPLTLTTIREPILYDVLEKSSVLVAAYSTTILESIALGTPAVVFDAIVQRKLLPLDRIPGVTIAYSIDDLHGQLQARRDAMPPDRTALGGSAELRRYISDLDGHATERVAALHGRLRHGAG